MVQVWQRGGGDQRRGHKQRREGIEIEQGPGTDPYSLPPHPTFSARSALNIQLTIETVCFLDNLGY